MFDATQDEEEKQPTCHHQHQMIKVPIWFFESLLANLDALCRENRELKRHLNPTHEE